MGTGKILYSSFKVQLYFPIQGSAVVVKKYCPIRGYAAHGGNFSSLLLLSLSWEYIIVPFMTHREFLFPSLAACAAHKGNLLSPFLKMTGLGHFPRFVYSMHTNLGKWRWRSANIWPNRALWFIFLSITMIFSLRNRNSFNFWTVTCQNIHNSVPRSKEILWYN